MSDVSQTQLEFRRQETLGALAAGSCYFIWGLSVMYYRQLEHVSPFEILAHRALWSIAVVLAFLVGFRRLPKLLAVLQDRATLRGLCLSGLLIGSNWLIFIWAVNTDRILETSLAYFINPLMSVLVGVVFLGERVSIAQKAAIALAALAVTYSTISLGYLPWISLYLATTFAAYGYLKKMNRVEAPEGLFIELLVIAPFGIAWLVWQAAQGVETSFLNVNLRTDLFLFFSGIVTTAPLLLFAYGATRIRLTTLGLLQYLVPTTSFSIAVWVYGEHLGLNQIITFGLIWFGLVIFTFDTWRSERRRPRVV